MSGLSKSLRITRPTLILDRARALRNIAKMARKAGTARVRFRPHFKTHQSTEIGQWFREYGVDSIAVSSVRMGQDFARYGWSDITVAFPVNLLEIEAINALAIETDLALLVDSEEVVSRLHRDLVASVRVWIKIDSGYGRAGIPWDCPESVTSIARKIHEAPGLILEGVLTHSGHSYFARSPDEIRRIHGEAVSRLKAIRETLETEGFGECKISIGDTPTCSLAEDFEGVDEIRPGNFVFNDVMQYMLGTCGADEIAVAVACPVVGKYPRRREIAVYGGAVHLSKESLLDAGGRRVFGYRTSVEGGTLGSVDTSAPVVALAQEHGILQIDDPLMEEIEIGDVVFILPVHSCLTCNLHREYLTLDGTTIQRL